MEIKARDVIARIMNGFGFAAIFTLIALTILLVNKVDPPLNEIWKSMLGSMIMGAFYGAASYLFQIVSWSPLKQVVIHFSLSVLLFLPIGLWTGWLPFEWKPLLIGLVLFAVMYSLFWCAYSYYYWRLTKEMNDSIHKK
ncbi:DUF3021 domain-containing protein [Paenibacillus septentrionalis]|uniref:DUF3021 domain-containing protein n=1 Tax=Paenibacillus septentrionalis TaxID=429342 RepID=A0ABW1V6E4_9BACL